MLFENLSVLRISFEFRIRFNGHFLPYLNLMRYCRVLKNHVCYDVGNQQIKSFFSMSRIIASFLTITIDNVTIKDLIDAIQRAWNQTESIYNNQPESIYNNAKKENENTCIYMHAELSLLNRFNVQQDDFQTWTY
jgi:hypothetical protein